MIGSNPAGLGDSAEGPGSGATDYPAAALAAQWRQLTDELVLNGLWNRPGLSPRDRSIATLAWLFGTGRTGAATEFHIRRGHDNGLSFATMYELAVHQAFYAGWPTGSPAIALIAEVAAKVRESAVGDDGPDLGSPAL